MSGAGNMFTQRAPDAQAVLVANVEVVAEGDGGAELLGVAPRRLLVVVAGRSVGPVGDVFRLGVWRRLLLAAAAAVGVSAGERNVTALCNKKSWAHLLCVFIDSYLRVFNSLNFRKTLFVDVSKVNDKLVAYFFF